MEGQRCKMQPHLSCKEVVCFSLFFRGEPLAVLVWCLSVRVGRLKFPFPFPFFVFTLFSLQDEFPFSYFLISNHYLEGQRYIDSCLMFNALYSGCLEGRYLHNLDHPGVDTVELSNTRRNTSCPQCPILQDSKLRLI